MLKPSINEMNAHHFQIEALADNEGVWIDVAPFSLYVKCSGDEIAVDVHTLAGSEAVPPVPLASALAYHEVV